VGAIHERTRQFVYRAHSLDKVELVARALQAKDRGLTMIFTRTKRTAQKISDELAERGFATASVHGDLGQSQREQSLRAFRSGKIDVLVATDIAARGIDVEGVTHVINYQCPEDEKTYVHRIGRTGRAGRAGVAITLVDWDDEPRWLLISEALGLGIPEPVETYSTSEHLYVDLDVPPEATGRLPLGMRTREGIAAEPIDQDDSRKRPRRRTRQGGAVAGGGQGGGRAERTGEGTKRSTSTAQEPGTEGEERPLRRRRRRLGGSAVAAGQPPEADHDAQPGGGVAPRAGRRRRRTRGGKERGDGQPPTGEAQDSAD
jgi:superfamily II DNA/RNA helicase